MRIPQGQVTVRQIAALYPYDNELLAIEGTGKMVKDALENAARFFSRNGMPGFNYDMAEGVDYQIDPSRPEGDRIRNLTWQGKPLTANQKLRIALNNYRAGGSGGYQMFQNAKVVWRSAEDIRDLVDSLLHRTQNNPRRSNRKLEAGEAKKPSWSRVSALLLLDAQFRLQLPVGRLFIVRLQSRLAIGLRIARARSFALQRPSQQNRGIVVRRIARQHRAEAIGGRRVLSARATAPRPG